MQHAKLNQLTNMKEYRLHVVLEHVRKYVDTRAYISKGGVIKYSIAKKDSWNAKVHFNKQVLTPKQINTMFHELYG